MSEGNKAKLDHALRVVEKCKTPDGFMASAHLYPELWVRDLVFSEEVLLSLGHAETVRRHFESFLRLQRRDGQIPTVITGGWRRAMNQRFHFWTCDTEILFLIGAERYARTAGDSGFIGANAERLDRCRSFVLGRRNRWGLIQGGDWRDAVPNLSGRCLLSNQVLLAGMLEAVGLAAEAERLRQGIRDIFANPEAGGLANSVAFRDGVAVRDSHFDSFGGALALLYGTVSGKLAGEVTERLMAAKTAHGFRNMYPPMEIDRSSPFRSPKGVNAFVRNGAVFRNRWHRYQNSAVWPFVEARVASALRGVGRGSEADEASEKIMSHPGLFEWYSPLTGQGSGSRDQLWTAAAVISQSQI